MNRRHFLGAIIASACAPLIAWHRNRTRIVSVTMPVGFAGKVYRKRWWGWQLRANIEKPLTEELTVSM